MNRFKFQEEDVQKVIKHLRRSGKITPNDIGLPPWAQRLKNPEVRKLAHGKHGLFEGELQIVPVQRVDEVLRDLMLSSESDVPLSRDSGYYVLQKRYLGISRRALMSFLAKQTDLQLTQSRIAEAGRKGREVHHKGHLEADLVEGKKKDVRGLGKGYDWYWLTVIDRLTGYLDVEHFRRDNAQVPPAMERILDRMEAALGTPIKQMYTDAGSEFKARTQTLLDDRNIKHIIVARGNKVEKANATFQRIFYRLYRLKRGTFGQLTQQALAMFNNTHDSRADAHGGSRRRRPDARDALQRAPAETRHGAWSEHPQASRRRPRTISAQAPIAGSTTASRRSPSRR